MSNLKNISNINTEFTTSQKILKILILQVQRLEPLNIPIIRVLKDYFLKESAKRITGSER